VASGWSIADDAIEQWSVVVCGQCFGVVTGLLGFVWFFRLRRFAARYKVKVFPGIRTDSVVAKAIRQRQFIADVDSKSKCLEDYRLVSDQLLNSYDIAPEKVTNVGQQEATTTVA
jgi:hypothetical protein